ncbi:MAG TPA: valine--tRNA ligase [Thermoflexia bacterium]|nr:valine--tRNA ligase [Thermoflexia bacterium]
MTDRLVKIYKPQDIEERIYRWWEEQGYFRPETMVEKGMATRDGPRFCITMPPPNVTGVLHLGHAMTAAVEDLMTRYHRMQGYETLFLPGTDHAGIATQNVVERELRKEGLTRHDLGREKFIERCWEWAHEHRARITEQHKRLGVSCDWTRDRFTLDPGLSRAVRTAFVHLFKKGLIYRGTYLVNWCPRCTSAISDLENVHQEEQGHLWTIRYPIVDENWSGPAAEWGSGRWAEGATRFIEVATTRPETLLGDTAVAVHPGDERYKDLVGKTAVIPAVGRPVPIIADEAVDPQFGTGAVKVTPAHDPDDYEIGLRHGLEQVNILTDTAEINENGGPYEGLDRFECRSRIVADLEKEGLLVRVEPHTHAVGHCQRCDTITEPRISTQWFVRIEPLAEAAIQAVRDGRIRIVPRRFEKVYFNWLENIRDWCISRQLWWGHRIPVWYCDDCGGLTSEVEDPAVCAHCGSPNIHQDEDVLDTWFSSGLWPFSTLGWPDETEDMRRFYPTDVRETGYDILFFWVAREIMLGLEMTGQAPFSVVYLHGLIRNEKGQKISKSMPNAHLYDPLNIIEEFGADALRYTLLTSSTPGNDMNLDRRRIEGARNFANKIWQATRFALSAWERGLGSTDLSPEEYPEPEPGLPERWIASRLARLIAEVTDLIEHYQYGEAGRRIKDFLWGEFCDWYLEISKIALYADGATPTSTATQQLTVLNVLEHSLRLLHPFMPFVTEELWQALPLPKETEALILAPWPDPSRWQVDEEAEEQMDLLMGLIRSIRNVRAEYDVEPGKRIPALFSAGPWAGLLREHRDLLAGLARIDLEQLTIEETMEPPEQAATVVVGDVVTYLPLAGLVDLEAERERLSKQIADVEARIARSEALLAGEFARKAPPHVVQREREKLADLQATRKQLQERLSRLG